MKLLFIARHYTYFRNYDFALRELAARGHQIHLAVEIVDKLGAETAVQALARDCPGITYGMVPPRQAARSTVIRRVLGCSCSFRWRHWSSSRRSARRESEARSMWA